MLLAIAFRVPAAATLAWVALVPLFVALRRATLRQAALWGLLTGSVFFGFLLYWSAIFGPAAVFGLVGIMAASVGVFAAGAWRLLRLGLAWRLVTVPSLWLLVEWLRSTGSWGFPWGVVGYSQQPLGPVAQFVALGGVFGLSWIVVFVNSCLAEVALAERGRTRRPVATGVVTVAAIGLVLGWGLLRAGQPAVTPRLTVAGVQPSIDQWTKFDVSKADMIMRTLTRLTDRALAGRPAVLIWPETVIPLAGEEATRFVRDAEERAAAAGADFIYGAFSNTRGGGVSNSAVLVTPLGHRSRYGKVHLVPFGEYVPLRALIGDIGLLRMVRVDQEAASRPMLLSSSWGRLGTVICFESSDEALVRRVVNDGAQLLVVITNDGWFERTAASDQHFRITAMRAIENGIWTVQVSNNGISGIIDPRGRVLAATGLWERTVMRGRVGLGAEQTPYRTLGSLPVLLGSVIVLVGASLALGFTSCQPELLLD